ncbi:MAG: hypothetical protein GY757_15060 [bacterium]|nr:hypothetical protein [bacterium]
MNVFKKFDLILADYNKVEERIFLGAIRDFAEDYRVVVIKTFAILLRAPKINIQLKYLVLKSIGELCYKEFTPVLAALLEREDKVQIIYEAVKSLVRINSFAAYKVVVRFLAKNPDADFAVQVEDSLRELFSNNKLLFHFDVFYRDRGTIKNIDSSSNFLINNLPDSEIKELLPAINSKFSKIRHELMRLLKNRPNPLFYSTIYNYFKENAKKCNEAVFLLLCETLVINASLSKMGNKVFPTLRKHVDELSGNKKIILSIILLRLNTSEMIVGVISFYHELGFNWKKLIFENLNPGDFRYYLDFLRDLMVEEDNEDILSKVVEMEIYAGDYDYMFELLKQERKVRRERLLGILLDYDPPGIENYLKAFLKSSQSNKVLKLSLEYLLRHAANDFFPLIKKILFSGVSIEVKKLIVRNLSKFSDDYRKQLIEAVIENLKVVSQLKKDFLLALLGVMNEKKFQPQFEDKLLNRVLVLLEEASEDEVVNFIYFFDKYEIENRGHMELVIDELRLIQNSILKSGGKDDLVRMLHVLIKNIEKRSKLQRPTTDKGEK